ncbi:1136_t:CDS:2, partial [Acaulospora morrowiae]
WTSESIDIDNCIKEFQSIATEYDEVIEWIPFNRLSNIREIGKGGFGYVYSAIWLDGKRKILNNGEEFKQSRTQPYTVALKTLPGSPTSSADFLREFKNHMQCRLMGSSLEVYGLTKNTTTNQYMMVLKYANNGNLRCYLKSNFKGLIWKDKLSRLMNISKDLIQIHEAGYIHCDLHSGNIVLHKEGSWLERAKSYIIDLGLSREKKEELDEIKIVEDDISVIDLDELDETEKVEISNKFWESDEIAKQLPVTLQKHQDDTYTSQFIDTDDISQLYNKLVKSVNMSQRHDESVSINTT